MAAHDIVRKLTETDDDPDSPENFGLKRHFESPVARLALTNGFKRDDRSPAEERYVKLLRNGNEAWLRTSPYDPDFDKPMDLQKGRGGRHWQLILAKQVTKCDWCKQTRPEKAGLCPKCKRSSKTRKLIEYEQLAAGEEMVMNYLLGAMLQRLASWPASMPKPGEPGGAEAFFGEARKPKSPPVPVPDLPPEDDPSSVMPQYFGTDRPDVTAYMALMRHKESGLYVSGKVTRNDHHYVHERTTTFELEVLDIPAGHEAEIDELALEVQDLIQEEIVNINEKIYAVLNREWDYQQSDEAVDEQIEANDFRFTEEGQFMPWRKAKDGRRTIPPKGGFKLDQLSDEAKERARDWHREGLGEDSYWSEHIIEEWTTELEDMGFSNVEIAYSGFSSQGDGASFTADGFDLEEWTKWFFSNKPTEQGHPYTDDLFLKENMEDDDPNLFMRSLDKVPDHELIDVSSSLDSLSFSCVCGRWCFSGVARDESERERFNQKAKEEFELHRRSYPFNDPEVPALDKLDSRNFITRRRARPKPTQEAVGDPDEDDPTQFLQHFEPRFFVVSKSPPNAKKTYWGGIKGDFWHNSPLDATTYTQKEAEQEAEWLIQNYAKVGSTREYGKSVIGIELADPDLLEKWRKQRERNARRRRPR